MSGVRGMTSVTPRRDRSSAPVAASSTLAGPFAQPTATLPAGSAVTCWTFDRVLSCQRSSPDKA